MPLSGLRSIHAAKVQNYLLDSDHPQGAAKADFFLRFGFEVTNPEALEMALLRHPMDNEVVRSIETPFGMKSIVRCSIVTPDARNPCVTSVWLKPPGSSAHRFVTAYPAS